jgi:hypothetical protein
VEENDLQKYIQEQAKVEVEHTRSWPTKVMAFYIAIHFGLVGSLIALQKDGSPFTLPCWIKVFFTLLIFILSGWVVYVLIRNHINYLTYRNLQVKFQKRHLESFKENYGIPTDWFKANEVRLSKRFLGWGFYLYIVFMVTLLVVLGIWFVI